MKTVIKLLLLSLLLLFLSWDFLKAHNNYFFNFSQKIVLLKQEQTTINEVINLQLRWHHQFQFAGYYAALEKGFYQEEGLNVKLHAGNSQHQPIQEVLSGRAQYAEANSELLLARLQGKPLVALAAIFQHSPAILLTRRDSNITFPQDLIGKKVMLINTADDADFLTMCLNEGVNPWQIKIIPSSFNIEDLISGKVDAFKSYSTNEPYFLKQRNIAYNIIDPATYRVNFYSDVLFTSEAELRNNPKRVEAMRRATLKGWRYAMDHPQEIIDLLINKYHVQKSREHLEFEAQEMRKLIFPDLIEIGFMNPGRWQHMAEAFVKTGLIKPNYSLEGFIYDNSPKSLPKWVIPVLIGAVIVIIMVLAAVSYLLQLNRRLRKTKSTLHESEANLRKAQEIAKIGSWKYEFSDPIIWSEELYYIYGVSPETFTPTVEKLISLIHSDDRQSMSDWIEACAKGLKPDELEFRCIWPDGSVHFINGRGELVCDKRGDRLYMTGTAQDITQRKKSEEALRKAHDFAERLIETANVMIIGLNQEGQITIFNATAEAITGYSKEDLINRNWFEVIVPRERYPHVWQAFENIDQYSPIFSMENPILTKNGEERFISWRNNVLRQDGCIIGTISFGMDITERKQAEMELLEAKQQAESANLAKSQFLANMSHEIRTPMNAVMGFSHLALKTELNAKQRDYLEKISASANALLGVINDILDFSKIEAGMLNIEQADFNLKEVIDYVTDLSYLRANEKGLPLHILLSDEVPKFLIGDKLRIGQVLLNLVSNAIKFTQQGQILISVQLNHLTQSTAEVSFSVRDSGIGISPEELTRLFQPFSQADSSTTRCFGGTGLGLAISKHLVEMMGGVISVDSMKGVGSEFRFTVPLGLQMTQSQADKALDQTVEVSSTLNGVRVLLVEDNEINRLIIVELLTDVGVTVDVAENGQEAIDKLLSENAYYQAVLMDIQMPVMDGIETTCKMLESGLTLPVIALTAHAMEEEKQRYLKAGMNDHISKPIDPDRLYQTLTHWINL